MKRYLYIGYQTWIKIKYQKKRYFLYILSFYVGLLLPAFCLANIRSVDRVFYFTTFKKMNSSVQIDWFSEKFDILFPEGMEYSIKTYKEENFKQWGDKYVSIIGIEEKYHKYIFDRFNQIVDSSMETKGGSGLGLTITKHIIDMHNGEIYIESEVDKGTKFTIILPADGDIDKSIVI